MTRLLRAATAAGLMLLPLAVLVSPAHADEACSILDPACIVEDVEEDTVGDVADDPEGAVDDTTNTVGDAADDPAGTVQDTADDAVNSVNDTVDDVLKTVNPDPGPGPGPDPGPGPGDGNGGGGDRRNHGSGGNHDGDGDHGGGGTGEARNPNGSLGRGSPIPRVALAAFRGEPAVARAGGDISTDPTIFTLPAASTQPTGTSVGQTAIRVAGGLAVMALLMGLVGGFVFVQNRLDRRDPKLVPASLGSDRVAFG